MLLKNPVAFKLFSNFPTFAGILVCSLLVKNRKKKKYITYGEGARARNRVSGNLKKKRNLSLTRELDEIISKISVQRECRFSSFFFLLYFYSSSLYNTFLGECNFKCFAFTRMKKTKCCCHCQGILHK